MSQESIDFIRERIKILDQKAIVARRRRDWDKVEYYSEEIGSMCFALGTLLSFQEQEQKKLYNDFVFKEYQKAFHKIGIEIKSIDSLKDFKENILQWYHNDNINVFYEEKPLFIYPSFEMWLDK